MNKTASFAMVTSQTPQLLSGINAYKIKFRAWIPDYNPFIKVTLQRRSGSLWIAYLRVSSLGLSFKTVSIGYRYALKLVVFISDHVLSENNDVNVINTDSGSNFWVPLIFIFLFF
jgi:hypothetical protein